MSPAVVSGILQAGCPCIRAAGIGGHMTIARLIAVGFIYVCATLAWAVLGGSLVARTGEFDDKLSHEVALLWGGKHVQVAPEARVERSRMVTERVQENDPQGRAVTREVTRAAIDRVPIPLT